MWKFPHEIFNSKMSIQNSSFNKEVYHFISFIVRVVTIFHYNQKHQYVLLIQIFLIFTFGSMLVKLKNMAYFFRKSLLYPSPNRVFSSYSYPANGFCFHLKLRLLGLQLLWIIIKSQTLKIYELSSAIIFHWLCWLAGWLSFQNTPMHFFLH